MYDSYCAPSGFGFDTLDNDDPFVTNKNLETFNADEKAAEFIELATNISYHYRSNHILIPMGCDFQYSNARMNFGSMDKMIAYVNERYPNVTLMYSTPGQYLDSIVAANITWPTRYDDMFPYADYADDYWSGYFTSRANSKKQVRDGQANIHASNKMYALRAINVNATDDEIAEVLAAKQIMLDAMGVYQHHDAVSGTAKQYVADDYAYKLDKALKANNAVYKEFI